MENCIHGKDMQEYCPLCSSDDFVHLCISARALLGDRVRDGSATEEEIHLYQDLNDTLEIVGGEDGR